MGRWDKKSGEIVYVEKRRFYTMLAFAGAIGAMIAGMVVTALGSSC